jgi:polyphosphate glucokinase
MNVLVIDIGGTHVKILATGQKERREFESGKKMTPKKMVAGVKELAKGWKYDVVSIGYPGLVTHGKPALEPHNLGRGWVGFDFQKAFGCPVKIMNDAAMQALGSYKGGTMLFLGFGTGLGAAIVADGPVIPLELGHLSYRDKTYEDYVGERALEKYGKKKWYRLATFGIARFVKALHPTEVVLGGGNAKKFKKLPKGCRAGDNANAFIGGFRMWEENGLRKTGNETK